MPASAFTTGGVVGASVAAKLARYLPARYGLCIGFAALILVIAIYMLY
ncbi:hypothetical protein [Rhizobium mesoamericanum]|nr:hypothetical protein [Rhizobium mesoamericanum]